jgi:hypothetical protein
MGIYLNPGNEAFRESVNSKIYVDKSGMLDFTNSVIETENKYICFSRPRRFGKSMTAKMLAAYYDSSCDSHCIFDNLQIAKATSYEERINKSEVLYLDISWFRTTAGRADLVVPMLQSSVIKELRRAYPEYVREEENSLPMVLAEINSATDVKFVIIIDEWDCLFREDRMDSQSQNAYIELLRGLFKGAPSQKFIQLAYLTGILPIKKYGTQSALNNFDEYTMVDASPLEEYVGFTEEEVRNLCVSNHLDFSETQRWYDGYLLGKGTHVYSPKSVLDAIRKQRFGGYWTQTETYESLKYHIELNFDGLKSAIVTMLGGGRCRINPQKFQNDMTNLKSKDDVMTLLVHLGYLAYDVSRSEVFIPNQEVAGEFENAVEDGGWEEIAATMRASEELLEATLRGDEEQAARQIEEVHMANTSVLAYNNELSLSCTITLAYFSARKDYTLIRELPAGKGFADLVFVPRRHVDLPAIVVELKWDGSVQGAIEQIKEKQYTGILKEYSGNLLLVGINYDKKSKKHQCKIEEYMLG